MAEAASPPPNIKPFWELIPDMLKYPFHPIAVLTIGLYAVLGWIALYFPFPLGRIIQLATAIASYQFCYSVLTNTSRGNLEPPENFYQMQRWSIFWQQFALLFVLAVIVALAYNYISFSVALLLAIVFLFFLPMAVMALAIDQTLLSAFNVATLIEGIKRLGSAYLVMVGFLFVLIVLSWVFGRILAVYLPISLAILSNNFIALYFLVIMFFLMGYLIYQFHDRLGYELDVGVVEKNVQMHAGETDPVLLRVKQLRVAGEDAAARRVMREAIHREGPDSALNTQFRTLCLQTDAPQEWYGHAALTVIKLFESGKVREALDMARQAYNEYPNFRMVDGDIVMPLASAATERGQHQMAIRICQSFGKLFPGHKDMVPVHLLVARILFEKLGDDRQSEKIVNYLLQKHGSHPLNPEVAALHQQIQAMKST